jgi:hypothetical protein
MLFEGNNKILFYFLPQMTSGGGGIYFPTFRSAIDMGANVKEKLRRGKPNTKWKVKELNKCKVGEIKADRERS